MEPKNQPQSGSQKAVLKEAVIKALERAGRLVLRYEEVESVLRELVNGDELKEIDDRLYRELVGSTLSERVYIYRLTVRDDASREIFAFTTDKLDSDQVAVLEMIASLDKLASYLYDEVECDRQRAVFEVLHNLLRILSGMVDVEDVVKALETET
jgi:CRISPR/Cas system-associated protein Cas10 (large subunit of type III CRISPR-Cas system)